MDLIHPYNLDVNLDEIAAEVRTINPSLSEAIAHDVAHGGDAEVEQIDLANGNTDASDAARLILIASISRVKGEGLSPKARRELLGHSQRTLAL